jgi:hypothetical protein
MRLEKYGDKYELKIWDGDGIKVLSAEEFTELENLIEDVREKEKSMADQTQTGAQALPIQSWAIVELMGHVRLAGMITEENHFGAVVGRVDIPQEDGTAVTQFFGGGSIYRLTPTTEEIARAIALQDKPKPIQPWELHLSLPKPPAGDDRDDDGDDDEEALRD